MIELIFDLFSGLAKLTSSAGSMAFTGTRRRQTSDYALERGINWRRDRRSLTKQFPFDLFRGKAGRAVNVISLAGRGVLFDFNYGPVGGRPGSANYAPHTLTCLILPVDVTGPAVRIGPHVIESVQRIPFESEAFNRRFTVTSGDPLHATALVDQRMMEWLLAQPGTWRIEIRGGHMLCSAPLVDVARFDEMESFAREFASRIPAAARTRTRTAESA